MKRCPTCNRVYDDVGLKFCMDDGAELVLKAESDAPVTEVMPNIQNNTPETIAAPSPIVDLPRPQPPANIVAPRNVVGGMIPLVVIAAVLLIVGLFVLVLWAVVPAGEGILPFFTTRLARRLPMLLLALGGIAFAVICWKSHPRASLMTAVALGIYLVDMVLYTLILYWLPSIVEPMRLSPSASRWFYSVVYFVEDIVAAVTILLLVAAAFTDRKPRVSMDNG